MGDTGFTRILIATDGSEPANTAVDLAGSLARSSGASVRVVHIWNLEIHHRHTSSDAFVRREAERLVREAGDRLRGLGVQAECQLAHSDDGHVGALIAELVRQFEPDLLVVGSRGLSDWRSLVESGVGHTPAPRLTCPLLLVRARPGNEPGGPLRVLVVVASPNDVAATTRAAAAVAAIPGSSVLVVHVPQPVTAQAGVVDPEPHDVMRSTLDHAIAELAESGIASDAWLLRPGPVEHAVADVASRWHADVIVLGSTRIGDLGSVLFGSVTHDLLLAKEHPPLVAEPR